MLLKSEIACERPGVFDCIVEGVTRLMSFASTQPTRLLPIWKLVLPTVIYGLSHYIIASLAKYRVAVKMKSDVRLVQVIIHANNSMTILVKLCLP